jgi:hypothetical protein
MKLLHRIAVALAALCLTAGCATLSDVVQSKNEGMVQVYPVTGDQAWAIALRVFRWEGSDAIEEHRSEGYMLTSSGINFYSYGTVMGAWIEPLGPAETKVTVVTKRRLQTNVFTTLTESTFHRRFADAVAIVKSGAPLPDSTPASVVGSPSPPPSIETVEQARAKCWANAGNDDARAQCASLFGPRPANVPATATPAPPSMATQPPPTVTAPSGETMEQAQAKCWASAGSNSALKEKCAALYGPRPAYAPAPVRPAAPTSPANTPPVPTTPSTSVITPAKKAQIDLLERLRGNGSLTTDQFEIERAKIILAPAE